LLQEWLTSTVFWLLWVSSAVTNCNQLNIKNVKKMNEITIIQSKIFEVRGVRIMLDTDLAELYQVETRVLNQAVKRNENRFPEDFMFRLTEVEWAAISSQFVMTSRVKRPKSALPLAFTEHGALMLSSVLRSEVAIETSIKITRAFVAMRQTLMTKYFPIIWIAT